MNINLDRKDLINLVKGITPNYSVFENELVKRCGTYYGGFKDEWRWDSELNYLTDDELFKLYNICKKSWN